MPSSIGFEIAKEEILKPDDTNFLKKVLTLSEKSSQISSKN